MAHRVHILGTGYIARNLKHYLESKASRDLEIFMDAFVDRKYNINYPECIKKSFYNKEAEDLDLTIVWAERPSRTYNVASGASCLGSLLSTIEAHLTRYLYTGYKLNLKLLHLSSYACFGERDWRLKPSYQEPGTLTPYGLVKLAEEHTLKDFTARMQEQFQDSSAHIQLVSIRLPNIVGYTSESPFDIFDKYDVMRSSVGDDFITEQVNLSLFDKLIILSLYPEFKKMGYDHFDQGLFSRQYLDINYLADFVKKLVYVNPKQSYNVTYTLMDRMVQQLRERTSPPTTNADLKRYLKYILKINFKNNLKFSKNKSSSVFKENRKAGYEPPVNEGIKTEDYSVFIHTAPATKDFWHQVVNSSAFML